jgi:hypothetical protein
MNLSFKSVLATSALMLAVGHASATASMPTTVDLGAYTLSYSADTPFGSLAYTFSSGGNTAGFAWSFSNGINVASLGGGPVSNGFDLPSFTITANPGWTLSGPVTGFLGNLVYTELDGGTASASVTGKVAVNGSPALAVSGALDKTVSNSSSFLSSGYLSGTQTTSALSFSSLAFSDGKLTLSASGGTFVNISAQPQNEFKVSFTAIAAAVPEPESYAMFLAGLGLMAVIARRRNRRS